MGNKLKNLPWKKIGLIASIMLLGYSIIRLAIYGIDYINARETSRELRDIISETETLPAEPGEVTIAPPEAFLSPAAETTDPEESITTAEPGKAISGRLPPVEYPSGYTLVPRIQELRKTSEYIIGWLKMDDLEEPVVHKDNTFFLDHDATGKRNSNGAIFMDQQTTLLTRPYTILLYGHNMKTGAMFGTLRKYEEFSYCFKHRMISFDTLYEEGQYEIFTVATISLIPGKAKYVNLTGLQSADRETRKKALNTLIASGSFEKITEVTEEDQILLLITCVGDNDERLVVAAKRLL